MIGEVSSSEARAAGHVPSLPKLHELVKKRLPTPFLIPSTALNLTI